MRMVAMTILVLVGSTPAFGQTPVAKTPTNVASPRGYRSLFAPNPRLLSLRTATSSDVPAKSLLPQTSRESCQRTTGGREDANGTVQRMLKDDTARFTMLMIDPACSSNRR
jgi:hypothetical protein